MPNLIVGLGAAMPAFAESFPSNGLMLENKTYANAARYNNVGAYDGTVTASAEYEDILYQIGAGTYLPAGATVAAQCPANSYCPGVTDATYNESAAQGAKTCPSGYPNSAAGAGSITQCYTACKDSMVEHATAVSGNDYYGDGTDTCSATACEKGYHVEDSSGVIIEQTPLIDVDYVTEENFRGAACLTGNGWAGSKREISGGWLLVNSNGLTENNTWLIEYDDGVVYGRASCQSSAHDAGLEYLYENFEAVWAGTMSPDQLRSDLTPIVGAAKANYAADAVAAMLKDPESEEAYEAFLIMMSVVFGLAKDASFSTSDTGQYCYCQMTGFQSGSSSPEAPVSLDEGSGTSGVVTPWVFVERLSSADECADDCAQRCVDNQRGEWLFGRMLIGALSGARDFVAVGTCDANEIKINWTDATDEDIAANNAGMCTYGGDIRTPVRAATKPGKTFVGWKFSGWTPQPM